MTQIHSHRHMRSYGSPRMTRQLINSGSPCSENRVARLMRDNGLRARPRKPFRPKTTQPDHAAHPSPNLLAKAVPPCSPGSQLVSDITYIPTAEGWLYLAVVIDLFSRAIFGWETSSNPHSEVVINAIKHALESGNIAKHAIFHSDRGTQYTSTQTRKLLARAGLLQSMSKKGCPYDNAFAESTFAAVKNELLPDSQRFPTRSAARTAIFDYIESFYNRTRLHSALGYSSPMNFLKQYFQTHNSSLN